VNEVDLLLLCPRGLTLVEIKSRQLRAMRTTVRKYTTDNPLLLANRKAKRVASLLRHQDAFGKGKARAPFVAEVEVVFLSGVRPPLKLSGGLSKRVFLRGQPSREDDDGIVQALIGRLDDAFPRGAFVDANAARAIVRAINQADIPVARTNS
jgi:Nuclease-related domain